MRTIALLLAAQSPVEGPWVPLAEGVEWYVNIECRPDSLKSDLESSTRIEVIDSGGVILTLHPSMRKLSGVKARALVDKVKGMEVLSIYLEQEE